MSASVYKDNSTGSTALAASFAVPTGGTYRLVSVSCKFNVAPTTSENFTITLDANAGSAYDVLLYTLDPSAASTTDIFWQPDQYLVLEGGDAIDVAFANSDHKTYGAQITMERVA